MRDFMPPPSVPLLRSSALEQARLVREGTISSEELTRLYLERIAELNPRLSAFVSVMGERALRAARQKDRERSLRDPRGLPLFHGVPIGIKDLNGVRGAFRRLGSRAFRYLFSPMDDASVARIRRGGFVILGKLATPELGAMPVTEPDIHPPTRNPWDLSVTSGGSSGGAAAAVAAELLPIAQGNDGAGSIRIPASFCHLFGFKPSRGRVPNPFERSKRPLASCGPIARFVDDAAAMLDVQAGTCERRGGREGESFLSLARRDPGRLRVRFTTRSSVWSATPEISQAVERVAATLARLGHDVEPGPAPDGQAIEFLPLFRRFFAAVPVLRSSLLQPFTRWLREGELLGSEALERHQLLLEQRALSWFGDADIWLTPTVPIAPPKVGSWRTLSPEQILEWAAPFAAFTAVFNVTGQPAATLPVGISREGHPIGVQLAGRPFSDGTVLAMSRQLEEAMPWSSRHAPALLD